MIISCPNCDTAYNLSEGAISSEGRKIRCKRCSHVFWARLISSPSGANQIEIYYKDKAQAPSTQKPSAAKSPVSGTAAGKQPAPPPAAAAPAPSAAPSSAPAPSSVANKLASKLAAHKASAPAPAAPAPKVDAPEATTSIIDPNKPKSISDFDKRKVRSTLGELFGSSLGNLKKASQELNSEAHVSNNSEAEIIGDTDTARGTVIGLPIQHRQKAQQNNDFDDRGASHETSFGMPAITDSDRPAPAASAMHNVPGTHSPTTFGMPAVSKNDSNEESGPRRRQSTLWMLSEDESSAEDIAKAVQEAAAAKAAAQAQEGGTPATGSAAAGVSVPSATDSDSKKSDSKKIIPEAPSLQSIGEDLKKSPLASSLRASLGGAKAAADDDDNRRSVTLFGLAAPISSNTTHYGEDEDAVDFFSNDPEFNEFFDNPTTETPPDVDIDIDVATAELNRPENSNAESMASLASSEPLKPAEKDTARRLAKFLGRINAAQGHEQAADESQVSVAEGQTGTTEIGTPTAISSNAGPEPQLAAKLGAPTTTPAQPAAPVSLVSQPAPSSVPAAPSPAAVTPSSESKPATDSSDDPALVTATVSPQELDTVEIEKTVEVDRNFDFGAAFPTQPPVDASQAGASPQPLRTSGPIPITASLPPNHPDANQALTSRSSMGPGSAARPPAITGGMGAPPLHPTGAPVPGPPTRRPSGQMRQETRNVAARTQQLEPSTSVPTDWNPKSGSKPLFDTVENTDIIPRDEPEAKQMIVKSSTANIIVWIVTFIIVVIVGLLVAWFLVMKLL